MCGTMLLNLCRVLVRLPHPRCPHSLMTFSVRFSTRWIASMNVKPSTGSVGKRYESKGWQRNV
jgi:hypothetical protein